MVIEEDMFDTGYKESSEDSHGDYIADDEKSHNTRDLNRLVAPP